MNNKVSSKSGAITPKRTRGRKKTPTSLTIEEIEQIVEEHQSHGMRLAWSFLKGWQVRMHADEVSSITGMALVEAARRFDPSKKVAFKTFFFYHLRGLLLREISRLVNQSKINQALPTGEVFSAEGGGSGTDDTMWPYIGVESKTPEELVHASQITEVCRSACAELDELEQMVIQRHFINDEPLKNIAKELGYNRCHLSRVKSKALVKLHSFISEKLPIAEILNKPEVDSSDLASNAKRGYTGGRGRRKQSASKDKVVKPTSNVRK